MSTSETLAKLRRCIHSVILRQLFLKVSLTFPSHPALLIKKIHKEVAAYISIALQSNRSLGKGLGSVNAKEEHMTIN